MKDQNCSSKQLQKCDFSSWKARSEVWKMNVVCFSLEVRGWICHLPPLFHLESSVGCPENTRVPSHGAIDDLQPGGTMKSRQKKAGIFQEALINGNCCWIMGLSIRSPKDCFTTLYLHQGKGGALPQPCKYFPWPEPFM